MAYVNDFSSRFRKGLSSANPFTATGRAWCARCNMDVDHETASRHQGKVFAYKRRCKRCGDVIARGVYDNIPTIGQHSPDAPAAQAWSLERGEDRR